MNDLPWIEKYRPHKIQDLEQNRDLIEMFANGSKTHSMGHYLFYGPPGTGKTSAILAMCREIFGDHFRKRVIEFNASDDRGIDAVRKKIYRETKKYVCAIEDNGKIIPPYKVIILDEADLMTDEAQDALRVIIERYSKVTRFCFICNYISKITDAIKSRCMSIFFQRLDDACTIRKLTDIAGKENMDLSENIYQTIVDISNGDMRKAIMILQNIKYLYDYRRICITPISQLFGKQLKLSGSFVNNSLECKEITVQDIHNITATVSKDQAKEILDNVFRCDNIKQLRGIATDISCQGLPMCNVMNQIYKALLDSHLSDKDKASLFLKIREPLSRIKDDANDYLQLLAFLSHIYAMR